MSTKNRKPQIKSYLEFEAIERKAIYTADWLTTNQLARLLQISHSSLEKSRCTGKGPFATLKYRKIGRTVRYARSDVLAFLDEMVVQGRRLLSSKKGG